jgi:thioester reductase-like protein
MEDDPIEQDMRVFGGYPQSKWLAERVLGKAFEAGIPVSIYRPGLITGNSRTGGWNTEDFLYRIVRGALEAGCIPGLSRTENFLPVDVVADTVVHIATSGSNERFFHIDGFNPVSADQLIGTLNACGAALRVVPYEEWRRSINAPTNALFPLLPIFPERVDPERIARQLAFDNTNTRKALQGSNIRYPTLKELLPVYAKSLLNRAA